MIEGEEIPLKPELLSKATFLFLSTIASAALGYIALFFATRFIGEINYGIVAFAMSFAGLFIFITDMGLGTSHVKKVSEGKDLQSCLSVFMLTRLLLVGVYTALVFAALFFWEDILGQGYENPETHLIILIILLYYIQTSITYVFTSTFLAQRDVVRAQAIVLSDVMARALATLLVVAMNWGLVGLACTYAVEGAVALIIALILARGRLPRIRLNAANKDLLKQYVSFAAPIAISSIFGTFALYFDKIIIQYSMTSADTGIYFASQRLLSFYLALSPVIASVVYPAISNLNAQKDGKERISIMTSSLMRYFLLVTIPIMLFLVVFSKEILSIFLSASFGSGAMAFSLLSIGYFLSLTISPFTSQTLGMGLSRTYAKYQMISIILTIALDILLIPSILLSIPLMGLGINGAAISLMIGQFVLAILFYNGARKVIDLKRPKGIAGASVAGALSILVIFFIADFINISRFYDVVAIFLLYCAIYLCLIVVFRVLSIKELKDLAMMLRSKHLFHRPLK